MITQKSRPNKEQLKITNIVLNTKGLNPETARHKQTIVKNTPTVYYYGYELQQENIRKLIVDFNKFMPLVELTYIDAQNIMNDIGFPGDNAKITVILPSNHDSLANIFMDFKIQRYEVGLMSNSNVKKITIWGICNVEDLLISEYKSYENTSYDLFSTVAQDCGLGFMSNVDSSNDQMIWLNTARNKYAFLQDTANKAWVGESGFIWAFIDQYYNMNYINVESSLSQDITEIKWINTNVYDNPKLAHRVNDTIIFPFLTNEKSQKGNNSYFSGEKILNQSTDISLKRGYLRNVHFYDVDGNWGDKAGAYNIYDLDTITSTGSENNAVFLKGEPGSLDFYKKNSQKFYLDKIDTANMFPDFLWAKMQNKENVLDLQKISIQILLPVPNFNIRRFEKVKLSFFNSNVGINNKTTNTKLNGEWLVTGLRFVWNGEVLYQYVNLVKRELTINDL